ncbi:hypothetical protein DITRI_Ditri03aG0027400 [Diplodiscus trichospermus]
MAQDEIFWRQRSQDLWLREGDRNSRYFHNSASVRKKNNIIKGVRDDSGFWVTGNEIVGIFEKYFSNLFTSSNPVDGDIDYVANMVGLRVSDGMVNDLNRVFTTDEVKLVLGQMAVGKSPGPDGMSVSFCRNQWDIIGAEVTDVILDVLNNGKSLEYEGAIWRVGDGKSIAVWEDKWVNKPPTYKVVRPIVDPTPLTVDKIIGADGQWNEDLIQSFFSTEDQSAIMSIHLAQNKCDDALVWRDSDTGLLTTKAAYILAKDLYNDSTITAENNSTIWSYIWSAAASPKIRVFWWRIVRGIIPVFSILQHRGLDVLNICPACNMHGESIFHVLVQCELSRKVWLTLLGSNSQEDLAFLFSISDWLVFFDFWKSHNLFDEAFYVGWLLWCNRNKCLHDFCCNSPSNIVYTANRIVQELRNVHTQLDFPNLQQPSTWVAPPVGYFKLNTDASFLSADRRATCGIVLRDCLGQPIISASKGISGVSSVLHAELLAVLFGLEVIHQHGWLVQQVETDSLLSIQEINKGSDHVMPCRAGILEVRLPCFLSAMIAGSPLS